MKGNASIDLSAGGAEAGRTESLCNGCGRALTTAGEFSERAAGRRTSASSKEKRTVKREAGLVLTHT